MPTYPVELNEDAGLPCVVTIETIRHPRAVGQHGAVELTGAFGIVPDLQRDGWWETDRFRDRDRVIETSSEGQTGRFTSPLSSWMKY